MTHPSRLPIYLDHHATTPVDPRVAEVVLRVMTTNFGNANSVEHLYGEIAADLVAEARAEVAALVGASPSAVSFTSGSTEAVRLAIGHAVANCQRRPLRVALTTVEHQAVLDAVTSHLDRQEVSVRWLPVDNLARLNIEEFEAVCSEGIDLVCVMAANNEVGTVYPLETVARLARGAGASILVDATQAAGRVPIDVERCGITYLALSGHKIYGPKGIGALVTSSELSVRPGRGQIHGVGDGTPNVPGIAGLGEACRLRRLEMSVDEPRMTVQRDRLQMLLARDIEGLVVNGDVDSRLSNNLHVSIPGIPNDAVIARLRRDVALSSGAACSSGAQTPSHVLIAMGMSEAIQESALRIGTGKFTSDEEINQAAEYIVQAVAATARAIRGVSR